MSPTTHIHLPCFIQTIVCLIVRLPKDEAVKAELQANCSFGCWIKDCTNWWTGHCVCFEGGVCVDSLK